MKIELKHGVHVVSLSESNLKDLLAKIQQPPHVSNGLMRKCENEMVLRVVPETDEVHYRDRVIPQGPGFRGAAWRQN